jgi:hypothetical protein
MDIKAAFDTIKQDKVLRIVDSMLESDWGYALRRLAGGRKEQTVLNQGVAPIALQHAVHDAQHLVLLFKTRAVVEGA